MGPIVFVSCFVISAIFLLRFYRKMIGVIKSMDEEFSDGIKSERGFNNGAHGNFFVAKLYVLMLPLSCNLLLAVLFYFILGKISST